MKNYVTILLSLLVACSSTTHKQEINKSTKTENDSLSVSTSQGKVSNQCGDINENLKSFYDEVYDYSEQINTEELSRVDERIYEKFLKKNIEGSVENYFDLRPQSKVDNCIFFIYQEVIVDEKAEWIYYLDTANNDIITLKAVIPYPDGEVLIDSKMRNDTLWITKISSSIGDYDEKLDRYLTVKDSIVSIYNITIDRIQYLSSDSTRTSD